MKAYVYVGRSFADNSTFTFVSDANISNGTPVKDKCGRPAIIVDRTPLEQHEYNKRYEFLSAMSM